MLQRERLLKIGAIISSILLLILFLVWFNDLNTMKIFILEFIFFGILGLIVYLFIYKKESISQNIRLNETHSIIIDIVFFLSIGLSFWIIKDAVYIKPFLYYLFISLAISMLGIKILFSEKLNQWKALLQIFIVLFTIGTTTYIVNPNLVGMDTYFHYLQSLFIVKNGALNTEAGSYFHHPLIHILTGIILIISSSSEFAVFLVTFSLASILVFFAYLLLRKVSNEKTAITGAYLMVVSTVLYYLLSVPSPQNHASTFLLLSIIGIFYLDKGQKLWIIYWISALAVLFMHPVAGIVLIMILSAYAISEMVEKRKFVIKSPVMSFTILFIAYLMFIHYRLFVDIVEVFKFAGDQYGAIGLTTVPEFTDTMAYQSMLSYLGHSTIVFAAAIGLLSLLDSRDRKTVFIYLIPVIFLIAVLLIMLSKMYLFTPVRLLSYIDISLRLLGAFGVVYLISKINVTYKHVGLAFVIFIILSLFTVSSYLAGDNNRYFSDSIPRRYNTPTQSLIASKSFIDNIKIDSPLYVDSYFSYFMSGYQTRTLANIRYTYEGKRNLKGFNFDSFNNSGYFAVDTMMLEHTEPNVDVTKTLDENILKYMVNSLYNNGPVIIFNRMAGD